jgi:hypothetical protein
VAELDKGWKLEGWERLVFSKDKCGMLEDCCRGIRGEKIELLV